MRSSYSSLAPLIHGPLAGLAARAVIVLNADNVVRYTEMVSQIEKEPNYEAALAALQEI